jgi:UDP-N-acetylglucosamine--N-acetylmuramyl-(pentapeptide) pyrophosphoryl-undecaprenol N-acetylglucosamine transferase
MARTILFAGGGSGGHVYPLIAVADEIRRLDSSAKLLFVSSHGSIEEKLVPKAGYELRLIHSGKLAGQSLIRKLVTAVKVIFSIFQCAFLLTQRKPQFVFSAGGYAGAPLVLAAFLLGIPSGILEQNRKPGLANRWMAKFCKIVFLNFSESSDGFAGRETVVVGHPCRKEIEGARWDRSEAEIKWQEMPFRIFVFGGSQGAVGINRLVVAALPFLKNLNIEIRHQTGTLDFETVKSGYAAAGFTQGKVDAFIYDMANAYRAAHFVICRAGASSIAELAAAGKAALLIPLVSRDRHQEPNAEAIADRGACEFKLQGDLTGESLAGIIRGFYENRGKLSKMATNIEKMHKPNAAAAIANMILKARE